MTDTADQVFFNPLEPGYIENPWPHLAEVRCGSGPPPADGPVGSLPL